MTYKNRKLIFLCLSIGILIIVGFSGWINYISLKSDVILTIESDVSLLKNNLKESESIVRKTLNSKSLSYSELMRIKFNNSQSLLLQKSIKNKIKIIKFDDYNERLFTNDGFEATKYQILDIIKDFSDYFTTKHIRELSSNDIKELDLLLGFYTGSILLMDDITLKLNSQDKSWIDSFEEFYSLPLEHYLK